MKLDRTDLDLLVKQLAQIPDQLLDSGLEVFKQNTPVRSGNAKRSTRVRGSDTILADYDYASRLDDGTSGQSPDGMTDPTIQHWERDIQTLLRKL